MEKDIRRHFRWPLRERTVVPIAVVPGFFSISLSGENPGTKATASAFPQSFVLFAAFWAFYTFENEMALSIRRKIHF
ncbi:hypothetical protein [Paenibacillus sp. TY11]|uniref:hypothetical protein n=1 Tax=Paenibacillus sp. TY11 TaxID=3448633 RepID=UPI0040391DEE